MMSTTDRKKLILGCDIGNGYGYISVLTDSKRDPMPLFPNKYDLANIGMPTTAYVMPPSGEQIEVFKGGKAAETKYVSRPEQLIRAIKTRFKEGSISVPNVNGAVNVKNIYSAIARDLIVIAEEELANKNIAPIYDIVFTFPASFSDDSTLLEMMQTSIESLVIDGEKIHVLGRLPEPAAVAIDYLHYMQKLAPEEIKISSNQYTVLVYDLGHGTFDTAVVTAKSEGTPYVLHSKAGLPEVGGKNFDQILYDEIINELQAQYDFVPRNERQKEVIRQEAVKAKIALSDEETYTASIVNEDSYCDIDITRERFENLSQHLIFQTLELVQSVLDEATANGIHIDGIVLSGGASQMPMVKTNLEQLVEGAYPISLYRPSEAVSFGAARFAYGIPLPKPKPKPIPAPTPEPKPDTKPKPILPRPEQKETNQIMEQRTDCCYGIWMPSEGKLEGEVRFVISSGKARPVTSETVSFYSESERVVVRVYRSIEKNKPLDVAAMEDCESMLWIPFNVKPGARCEVKVTALENYDIQVDLISDKGDKYRKKTYDILDNII